MLARNLLSKINTRENKRTTSPLKASGGNNLKPQSGTSVRSRNRRNESILQDGNLVTKLPNTSDLKAQKRQSASPIRNRYRVSFLRMTGKH